MVSHIRWSSWTATKATGVGTYSQVVCTPSCVRGRQVTTTIPVVLSNPVKTATGDAFSTLTLNAGRANAKVINILN